MNGLTGWDDLTMDAGLQEQIGCVAKRVVSEDRALVRRCVSGDTAVAWTDAISIATDGVVKW